MSSQYAGGLLRQIADELATNPKPDVSLGFLGLLHEQQLHEISHMSETSMQEAVVGHGNEWQLHEVRHVSELSVVAEPQVEVLDQEQKMVGNPQAEFVNDHVHIPGSSNLLVANITAEDTTEKLADTGPTVEAQESFLMDQVDLGDVCELAGAKQAEELGLMLSRPGHSLKLKQAEVQEVDVVGEQQDFVDAFCKWLEAESSLPVSEGEGSVAAQLKSKDLVDAFLNSLEGKGAVLFARGSASSEGPG